MGSYACCTIAAVRSWLEANEPYLRLAYRAAVLALLIWLARLIEHADPGWYLSEIMDLLRRK